jgi:hypothetical protein
MLNLLEQLVQFAKAHTSDAEWEAAKEVAKFLIGAGGGWVLKIGHDRWNTRRARAFWRPFLSSDVRLVIGRFDKIRNVDVRRFERSGVLGVGDAIALAEIQSYLGLIGANPQVAYADRLEGDALKYTMILLGGPDANSVTRRAVKHISSNLRFGDPEINEIAIHDTAQTPERIYQPSPLDRDNSGTDYGLILRAPNPFDPNKEIMILAGSFGHGTWAAVRHVTSAAFLTNMKSIPLSAIECLVETDVELDTPQEIRQVLLRGIPEAQLASANARAGGQGSGGGAFRRNPSN